MATAMCSTRTFTTGLGAKFFRVNPLEAPVINPQPRLLLEVIEEALEATGQPVKKLRGSNTVVYVGPMCGDYEALRDTDTIPKYHAIGIARSIISNRISSKFGEVSAAAYPTLDGR